MRLVHLPDRNTMPTLKGIVVGLEYIRRVLKVGGGLKTIKGGGIRGFK